MKTSTPLCEMPTSKHPFTIDRYMHLLAELKEAAGGFAELRYAGHPYAKELVDLANDASRAVSLIWSSMRSVEMVEKAKLDGNE